MPVFTTPAFVLRTFPAKEADLVVRLYTEEFGRIVGIARGVRRPRHPMTGKLEILHLDEVKGFRHPDREMCSIDAVTPIETYTRLRSDLEGFYRVHYIAEMLDSAFAEEQAHPQFFALLGGVLTLMEHEAVEPDLGLRYLELHVLQELGYGLSFGECVSCHGAGLTPAGFEPGEGGFVCEACLRRLPEALRVPAELAPLLERLTQAPLAELGQLEVPEALERPLRHLCHRMLLYRLELPLRSARYLEEMDQGR